MNEHVAMKDELPHGWFWIGNKIMGICSVCDRLVRIDKPIFGSLHFCSLTEEEKKENNADFSGHSAHTTGY